MATPHRIIQSFVGVLVVGSLTIPAAASFAASKLTVVHSNTPALERHTVLVEAVVSSTCLSGADFGCGDVAVGISWASGAGSGGGTATLPASGGSATFQIPKGHVVPGLSYRLTAEQDGSSWSETEQVDVREDSDPIGRLADDVDAAVDDVFTTARDLPKTVDETREDVEAEVEQARQDAESSVLAVRRTVEDAVADIDTVGSVEGIVRGITDEHGTPGQIIDDVNDRVRGGETEDLIVSELAAANQIASAVSYATGRLGTNAARQTVGLGLQLVGAAQSTLAALAGRVEPLVAELSGYVSPLSGPIVTFVGAMSEEVGTYADAVCATLPIDVTTTC